MKTRGKLYKTYIRKSTEENHKKYKQYRNKLTDIIRNSKKMHYSKELENAEGDIASTWKVINEIICKNKSTKGSDTIKVNDQEITDSPEIAQAFNSFFVNIGPDLASKIQCNDINFTDYLPDPLGKSIFFNPTDQDEIIKLTKALKSKI